MAAPFTAQGAAREGAPIQGIAEFAAHVRGEVIAPGDDAYDTARRVWNGSIDKHPALIVRCAGPADVISAVTFARERELPVAVRGGGHNIAGLGVCDGGALVDLARMKGVRVDPARRTVWAQTGLVWGELDRETQAFGLAAPGGVMSTTGIAGYTLGGGIGWLTRKHGLACDNLLSADIVTADGTALTVSATQEPDLFWGLRGGGGNFGAVTAFEYQAHPVGPTVLAGLVFYPLEHMRAVLRFTREYPATAPDELGLILTFKLAPAAPFLPTEAHGKPVIIVGFCYAGPPDEGERVMRPLLALGTPLANLATRMPYAAFQRFSDANWAPGFQNYWKADYLTTLSGEAIETIYAQVAGMTSPLSDMKLVYLGGALNRFDARDSAFGQRDAPILLNINGRWADPAEDEQHIAWVRSFWEAMRPYSTGGVYVNFLGDEGADRVRAAYGADKYDQLARLKARYDPANVFRFNQNIKPVVTP